MASSSSSSILQEEKNALQLLEKIQKAGPLELSDMTNEKFEKIWHDHNTRAQPYDGQFWRPLPPKGYYSLGDVVEHPCGHGFNKYTRQPAEETRRRTLVAKDSVLLAPPVRFELLWNDSSTWYKAKYGPVSIWKPVAPKDFVALGCVANAHHTQPPSTEVMRCVHKSCIVAGRTSRDSKLGMIWSDRKTRCKFGDVSCWLVESPTDQDAKSFNPALPVGTFWAHKSHLPPEVPVFCLPKARTRLHLSQSRSGFFSRILSETSSSERTGTTQESIKLLTQSTYFDLNELLLLYARFQTASGRTESITKQNFSKLFERLQTSSTLLNSIFDTIDFDHSNEISFEELVHSLSTMCRGRLNDRIAFAFRVCDLHNTGYVTRKYVLEVTENIERMMQILDQDDSAQKPTNPSAAASSSSSKAADKVDYFGSSANERVDNLFRRQQRQARVVDHTQLKKLQQLQEHKTATSSDVVGGDEGSFTAKMSNFFKRSDSAAAIGEDTLDQFEQSYAETLLTTDVEANENQAVDNEDALYEGGLTELEFEERAKRDPEFANCFGLFDFFYRQILAPIERTRYGDLLAVDKVSGWLQKEKGEGFANQTLQLFSSYDRRWFVAKNGFFAYYKQEIHSGGDNQVPLNVVSLSDATVSVGPNDDGEFYLQTPSFSRKIIAPNKIDRTRWTLCLRRNANATKFRFQSFAPVRGAATCQWFVNGEEYFRTLIDVLSRARERVFIADWYFAPGLFLRRGENPPLRDFRLDLFLQRLAKRNVKIYILVWNAPPIGFDLQVKYIVSYMQSLHANIHVLAHPWYSPIIWSHHQKFVVVDDLVAFVGGIDLCYNRYDDKDYKLVDLEEKFFPGRDYGNLNFVGEQNGPSMDRVIDRRKFPRMPWHDIHMMASANNIASDVASNFIQRWNHTLKTTTKQFQWFLMPPTTNKDTDYSDADYLFAEASQRGIPGVDAQVIRSAAAWSAGVLKVEQSIYHAYRGLILNAKHYIYIENQYFISTINQPPVVNKVAEAIYQRVRRAILGKETFRVFVLLPVFPAGDLATATTRYLVKYVYKTINRSTNGKSSILEKLANEFPNVDLSQYIRFFALRNHARLPCSSSSSNETSIPCTEQVYIHAKLMIVDDLHTIIGSANINDRSLLGNRDSEIGIVTTDRLTEQIESKMNGATVKVGKFAQSLRMRLWRDHLGLSQQDNEKILDPIHADAYKLWCSTADSNTSIYKSVFNAIPDHATKIEDILGVPDSQRVNVDKAHLLNGIRGFLVNLPPDFLVKEQCSPTVFDAEYVMPKVAFL